MNRRQINLPSGATCIVRKLSRLDFVGEDRVPLAFPKPQDTAAAQKDPDPAVLEFAARLGRIAITKACGAITMKDGRRYRIVAKHFADCGPDELSVEEVDNADADAIINAVSELSGMTQEAGREAAPFSPGQAPAGAP